MKTKLSIYIVIVVILLAGLSKLVHDMLDYRDKYKSTKKAKYKLEIYENLHRMKAFHCNYLEYRLVGKNNYQEISTKLLQHYNYAAELYLQNESDFINKLKEYNCSLQSLRGYELTREEYVYIFTAILVNQLKPYGNVPYELSRSLKNTKNANDYGKKLLKHANYLHCSFQSKLARILATNIMKSLNINKTLSFYLIPYAPFFHEFSYLKNIQDDILVIDATNCIFGFMKEADLYNEKIKEAKQFLLVDIHDNYIKENYLVVLNQYLHLLKGDFDQNDLGYYRYSFNGDEINIPDFTERRSNKKYKESHYDRFPGGVNELHRKLD